jgi:hypothetical protein
MHTSNIAATLRCTSTRIPQLLVQVLELAKLNQLNLLVPLSSNGR